jgi:hypothetical protein
MLAEDRSTRSKHTHWLINALLLTVMGTTAANTDDAIRRRLGYLS